MSVKIYTAYRVKTGVDLWPLLREIRLKAEARAKAALWQLYPIVAEAPSKAFRKMYDNYVAQFAESSKNEWDLDVNIAIWRAGRRYVMIPFSGSGHFHHVLDFLKTNKSLEDYSYWNNTDRPPHVTAQAWQARATTWGRILEGNGWDDHLVLDIVSVTGFNRVNPIWAPEYRERLRRLHT